MPSVYDSTKRLLGQAGVDWAGADVRVLLATKDYVPDVAADAHVSDVIGELRGGSYERRRVEGRSIEVVDGTASYLAANVTWPSLGTTNNMEAASAVVFKFRIDDRRSPLIAFVDFVPTVTNGGEFTVRWGGGPDSGPVFHLT